MPPPRTTPARTVGSSSFDPEAFLEAWKSGGIGPPKEDDDLRAATVEAFGLKENDDYVYHATASVTLAQVQQAIRAGDANGLHAWYKDEQGQHIPPPPSTDITAYVSIFSPSTSTPKALTAFASNAKKGSLRATISSHLQSHFHPPTHPLSLPTKVKTPPPNPYLDIWAWTCHTLEWAGPIPSTVHTHHSHPILPVLYHHYGCICPSHDALHLLHTLSTSHTPALPIIDLGSGSGYWTLLLRRLGLTVTAIDDGTSEWRTRWISDTIYSDGIAWLRRNAGAKGSILFLGYPQVGGGFTENVVRAFAGEVLVVAGTQNANGFTAFRGETVADWMEREMGAKGWRRVGQVPLPSFAGKDEALFVFLREEEGGSG
ncbi:MAG: hypothetical protein Q9165_002427 [Trypethelium subeluteriae]